MLVSLPIKIEREIMHSSGHPSTESSGVLFLAFDSVVHTVVWSLSRSFAIAAMLRPNFLFRKYTRASRGGSGDAKKDNGIE